MKSKVLFFLLYMILNSVVIGCSQSVANTMASAPAPTNSPFPTKALITPTLSIPTASTYDRNKFLQLYHTNGGCQLPCWWSVIPRKTTKEEVIQQFTRYGDLVIIGESPQSQMILSYPSPNDSIDYISSIIYFDERSGIANLIYLPAESMMYNGFNPTELLDTLGKPDQVQMTTSQIAMLYDKQNVLAIYDIQQKLDTNQVCFENFNGLQLGLSPIDNGYSLAYDPIDITNVQTFYDAFKTWKDGENCFSLQ